MIIVICIFRLLAHQIWNRTDIQLIYLMLAGALALLVGYTAIVYRVESIAHTILCQKTEPLLLRGQVIQLDTQAEGKCRIHMLLPGKIKKIRINCRGSSCSGIAVGDIIETSAVLMPPPNPVIPGGFDFARFAYFRQIGAIGYTVRKTHIVESANHQKQSYKVSSAHTYVKVIINRLRHNISDRMKAAMGAANGAIAAALIVGESSGIHKDDFDAIRTAGIAHIIAISGMHLMVVIAIIFFIVRFLISRSETLSMKWSSKKFAATVTILISFLYLPLTGIPISAVRAIIMSTIALLSILLDRNADAMKSLSISAIIILLTTPEDILSPSFQMSYAACGALISSFKISHKYILSPINSSKNLIVKHHKKLLVYCASIAAASTFAGFATAPFAIYHFHQFSPYGIITNLMCVPLSNFYIMPLGMISLLLMPLNIENIALYPMSYGLNIMLTVSKFIASLPYSNLRLPSLTALAITTIALGEILLFLCKTQIRYVGIALIIIGFITLFEKNTPDILISENSNLFAIKWENKLIFSSFQKDKFTREAWEKTYREKSYGPKMLAHYENIQIDNPITSLSCDKETCIIHKNGTKVLLIRGHSSPQENNTICNNLDLFINLYDDMICANTKVNITRKDIEKSGAHAIYIGVNHNITIENTKDSIVKGKPWSRKG